MSELVLVFDDVLNLEGVGTYRARVCGRAMEDGKWEGWIEFIPVAGGRVLRTPRETTQPKRSDLEYWATGLTPIYLEGALERSWLAEVPAVVELPEPQTPAYGGPAKRPMSVQYGSPNAPIDPFAAYAKGEELLRQQLSALSDWQLRRVIEAYGLSSLSDATLTRYRVSDLIEVIVAAVRTRTAALAMSPDESEP
jgi:hypothetical protein